MAKVIRRRSCVNELSLLRLNKSAQFCTIFETMFLLRGPRTGGAWAVCTKCTKRGMFSAQARRGSKRGRWGVFYVLPGPPANNVVVGFMVWSNF
ncbi:hypothetical protein JEQ41_22175, partial [Klebsiella pneumoniae]|nr:hypothetical protein [Klebsiella pneumoniae]